MANKPRNSVLYMFDPLESLTTPRRDGSPDSGSSDKENDVQPGDVTVFFNRVYTSHKNVAPKTPNGKLIDFGDTTTNDVWDSGEEDVVCTAASPAADASDEASTPSERAMGRKPLADIEIEETLKLAFTQQSPADEASADLDEEDDATPLRAVTVAPTGAPLADVINSINLSALTISGSAPPSPLANRSPLPPLREEADEDDSDEEYGMRANYGEAEDTVSIPLLITVSSPTGTYEESNSLTDLVLPISSDSPTDRLFASSTVVPLPPTRRPLLRNRIPNDDPRRTSVDLHTSFSMQMQSTDMSFDLLNDKISFHAGDSMWAGGDEDDEEFDMAAEMKKMEAAASEYACGEQGKNEAVERSTTALGTSTTSKPDKMYLDTAASAPSMCHEEQNEDSKQCGATQLPVEITGAQSNAADPSESPAPGPITENPPKVSNTMSWPSTTSVKSEQSTKAEHRPPVKILTGSPTPAPSSLQEQSPPPIAPAPIPALRIVKKTWKVHGRTDSANSAGSSASTGSTSSSASITSARSTSPASSIPSDSAPGAPSNEKPAAPAPEPFRPRTVIRGVQRPPAGAELTSAGVILPATTATQGPIRPGAVPAKSRASLTREAPSRFAAAGVQRPNLQQGQRAPQLQAQKVPPAAAASRAQRTAAGTTGAMPRSAGAGRLPGAVGAGTAARTVGTVGGLRAPAASGIPASKSSSALPRPASRLPAPSAGVKSRDTKMSAPGARVVSSGARRAF